MMLANGATAIVEPALDRVLDNPALSHVQQADIVIGVLGDVLDVPRSNFIRLLSRNKRVKALAEIARLYELYRSDLENTLEVRMVTAFEVGSEETKALEAALRARLGKAINLCVEVDSSLIGGVILHARDLVIDGSVKGKLAKLAQQLNY